MPSAREILDERSKEIDAYLQLIGVVEYQATSGKPKIEGAKEPITPQQQKILNAAVYMHLYNLIEAVATRCIDSVGEAAAYGGARMPGDLSDKMRKEWVRVLTNPYLPLSPETRHQRALDLLLHLVDMLPVAPFKIEKGGGSWHDGLVDNVSKRLGLRLRISRKVRDSLDQKYKDDKGPLAYIKKLRNDLAHGSISFEQCGEGVTVGQLSELKETTVAYLYDVVSSFEAYVNNFEYLHPTKRPVPAPPPAPIPVAP